MVAVYDILGGDTLVLGLDGDGYAMFVAAADEEHVFSAQAQEVGVDVGRDVDAGEMSYMYRSVGIGEGRGDKGTFKVFFHLLFMVENR